MECWALGQVHDGEAGRALVVFLEDEQGGVVPVGGEGGDFAEGEFVGVFVGGAGDVGGVGEEGYEEGGWVVEGGV